MTQSDLFRAIVGTMILISVILAVFVSPWWMAFTAFIGANMLQSAFTRFCPMDMIIARTKLPETRIPRNG
jgi:hypothetical protein